MSNQNSGIKTKMNRRQAMVMSAAAGAAVLAGPHAVQVGAPPPLYQKLRVAARRGQPLQRHNTGKYGAMSRMAS